jgi:hypothetical protein
MPTNVDGIIRKLSAAQRKKVESRAAQLIAEEMTLRELRHARKLTQVRMAKTLGITQESFRGSKSAAICRSPRCGRPSRRWADGYRFSLASPTARRLFYPAY